MLVIVILLIGASVALAVLGIAELVIPRPPLLSNHLAALARRRGADFVPVKGRDRIEQATQVLLQLGGWLIRQRKEVRSTRELLTRAGFRHPDAITLFWGIRIAMLGGGVVFAMFFTALLQLHGGFAIFAGIWCGALAWMLPVVMLRGRERARQRELLQTLPDAIDLLVVCVEAGLGLNQAVARMAEEIRHFSEITGEEFALVNLEVRAGAPREVALRNLGERSGLDELRSLGTVLVQADRFGTSVGQALRVHAETLRTRRRQKTEEAAAKTSVKLLFPLVTCIFPTVFVVVLGPALIQVVRTFTE